MKIDELFVDFLVNTAPEQVLAFRPSAETQAGAYELISREKLEGLNAEERADWTTTKPWSRSFVW